MEQSVTDLPTVMDETPAEFERVPRLAAGVRLMPADFGLPGEARRYYLAVRPSGEYLRLTRRAHDIVQFLQDADGSRTYSEAALHLSTSWHTIVDEQTVYRLVQTIVAPSGLLDGVVPTIFGQGSTLTFRIPLVPRGLVRFVTAGLTWLYHPVLAIPIALAAFAITVFVSASLLPSQGIAAPDAIGWAYLYTAISVIWHELGHATACRRFRAPTGPIGFGLYFIYPAFYTDVTGAWQLPRRQRAIVDVGGIYFQSMVLLAMFVLYFLHPEDPGYRLAMVIIAGTLIFSLNPFLRFDGYWVLNDLLGLVALDRMRNAVTVAFVSALRTVIPHPIRTLRELSQNLGRVVPYTTPLRYKLLLALYMVGAQIFWIWFLVGLGSWAARLVSTYPTQVSQFLSLLSAHRWAEGLPYISSLLLPCFIIFGLVTMVIRLTRRGKQTLMQQIDESEAYKRTW